MRLFATPRRVPPPPPPTDPFAGRAWIAVSFLTDLVMLWIAVAVAFALEPRGSLPQGAGLLGLLLAGATLGHLAWNGGYSPRSGRRSGLDLAPEVTRAGAVGGGVTLAASALLAQEPAVSSALVLAAVLGTVLVGLGRTVLQRVRRRARMDGRSGQGTIIVGAGWVGAELERRLLADPGLGIVPVGFLDADPAPAFLDAGPVGRVLGTPADLGAVARSTGATHVVVAFSSTRDAEVVPIVRAAQALGLEVSVVPRMFEDVSARQQVGHIGGMAICELRTPNPRAWPYVLKHAFGRTLAALITLLASPLFLAIALAVRASSPGPVFFRQRRVGRDGRVFEILKFRTMELPAERLDGEERRMVAVGTGPGGVEGDDRRTAVGTLLRRSSLDELPQLLNVLLGHMSLVGPRPERPEFVALFGEEVRGYADRHRVKSGITGWAQVHGLRGQTSIGERIALDNWYVANWSFWLDVKILLMTPREVLRSRAEAATGASAAASAPGTGEPSRPLHDLASRG